MEYIQLHAVAGTILVWPQCPHEITDYKSALVDVGSLATSVGKGQVSVKAHEMMVQSQDYAIGIDILEEVAIACFEKTPPNIDKIATKFVVSVGG